MLVLGHFIEDSKAYLMMTFKKLLSYQIMNSRSNASENTVQVPLNIHLVYALVLDSK